MNVVVEFEGVWGYIGWEVRLVEFVLVGDGLEDRGKWVNRRVGY